MNSLFRVVDVEDAFCLNEAREQGPTGGPRSLQSGCECRGEESPKLRETQGMFSFVGILVSLSQNVFKSIVDSVWTWATGAGFGRYHQSCDAIR